MKKVLVPCLALLLLACSGKNQLAVDALVDAGLLEIAVAEVKTETTTPEPLDFRVMTFNCGTTNQVLHKGQGGYTAEHGDLIDASYRNNLAWAPAEEALRQFIAAHQPQVVVLQEVYYDGWCETDDLELPSGLDMVCDGYDKDAPLQIRRLLGDQYHAACAWHFADLCVGVRKDFGQLAACQDEVCIDALPGTPVDGCSSSARVARAEITLVAGGELTVVAVHTNAGMSYDDQECRGKQFAQVFEDSGDGAPAASGTANVAMGDMNTDPFAFVGADSSLDVWNKYVGEGKPFHYISADSYEDPVTHVTFMHLDHVISDSVIGECLVHGESPGTQPVMDSSFFDHRPVVCDVTLPQDGGVLE
jgi:endonuclease/exonuclease/phosphatase family metal-dependent hydrolase